MIVAVVALIIMIPIAIVLTVSGVPWFVGVPIGLLIGLAVAVPLVLSKTRGAADSILASLAGQSPDPVAHARLINLVEGLSLSTGVVEPTVTVLAEQARNAMTVSDESGVTIVITQGLIDALDRMELEGVVAELLIRAKDGDADLATLVASLVTGFASGPLAPFSSFVAKRSTSLFDEDRDLLADQAAVGVTRYPPGLASAFVRLKSGMLQPACATPSNAHLWLIPPPDAMVPSHPLALRIDVLEEI